MIVFLIVLVACFLLQLVLPWWVIVLVSFITCAVFRNTGKVSLWAPFFAVLLLWTSVALFKTMPNDNILVTRVAEMLGLKSWWLVLIVTALLGSFVAAVSGFCGHHFRKAIAPHKTSA
jgi:CDP-diglyceride synthetase